MSNQTFNVSVDFIIDALQARYDEVSGLWASYAAHDLWQQALDVVEECGIGDNITSPSIFVDNYLINGEFVSKEDDMQWWLDCDGDSLSEKEIDEKWLEYCKNNACLYNKNFACLSF